LCESQALGIKLMPKVLNIKVVGQDYPLTNASRIDRKTMFGNRFIIGRDGTRDEVCDKFNEWVRRPSQRNLRNVARKWLKGRDLLCWCMPERCHGDTWLVIAAEEIE
jgi:hypothetical protein